MDAEGNPKVLDFGLAKPADTGGGASSTTDSVLTTEEGRLLGTPTYMAPEQARGRMIDKRIDVWAFGCVLYECLTGRRAFDGESMGDVLAAVLEKQGLRLHDRDLYVNAAGGLRLAEPAADLGILAAIASSLLDRPLPEHTAWLGEVGLVGEVRAVAHPGLRLREIGRHGFRQVVAPERCREHLPDGLELVPVQTVGEALRVLHR